MTIPFEPDQAVRFLMTRALDVGALSERSVEVIRQIQARLVNDLVVTQDKSRGLLGPVQTLVECLWMVGQHYDWSVVSHQRRELDYQRLLSMGEELASMVGGRSLETVEPASCAERSVIIAYTLGLDRQPWVVGDPTWREEVRLWVVGDEMYMRTLDIWCHAWLHQPDPGEVDDLWKAGDLSFGAPGLRTAVRSLMEAKVGEGLIHLRSMYCALVALGGQDSFEEAKADPAAHGFRDRQVFYAAREFLLHSWEHFVRES